MQSPKQGYTQPNMFQYIDLEDTVPAHHILRKLKDVIDFSQVHDWVKPLYAPKMGRPSVNAELVVRLVVLEYFFNHSERELFDLLPMHAGYLWFCGLDFESSLPDRSTLVKTRALWRRHGIFEHVMTHIVDQCIAAGLVHPDVHAGVDGSQVRANASIHSMEEVELAPVQTIEDYLTNLEQNDSESPDTSSKEDHDKDDDNDHHDSDAQPKRSDKEPSKKSDHLQENASHENFHGQKFSNETHRSTTDPEARLYKKSKGQEAYLRYLVHDLVDVTSGVILDTDASVAFGRAEREVSLHQLAGMRFKHPHIQIQTLSADKAYGTPDYLRSLFNQGIIPLISLRNHELEAIPTWQRTTRNPEHFRKRQLRVERTRAKNRATQIQLDGKYQRIQNERVQCEHDFAEAKTVHGMDRAKSRGLDCMQEQALCTAIVQNLKKLCRSRGKKTWTGASVCQKSEIDGEYFKNPPLISRFFRKMTQVLVTVRQKNFSLSPDF